MNKIIISNSTFKLYSKYYLDLAAHEERIGL